MRDAEGIESAPSIWQEGESGAGGSEAIRSLQCFNPHSSVINLCRIRARILERENFR